MLHRTTNYVWSPATAGMLFCPESPAWLALKGQRKEALAVAEKLWGADAVNQLGTGAQRGQRGQKRCMPGAVRVGAGMQSG